MLPKLFLFFFFEEKKNFVVCLTGFCEVDWVRDSGPSVRHRQQTAEEDWESEKAGKDEIAAGGGQTDDREQNETENGTTRLDASEKNTNCFSNDVSSETPVCFLTGHWKSKNWF